MLTVWCTPCYIVALIGAGRGAHAWTGSGHLSIAALLDPLFSLTRPGMSKKVRAAEGRSKTSFFERALGRMQMQS